MWQVNGGTLAHTIGRAYIGRCKLRRAEYSVAKSSLVALTKNIAHKLNGKIRVNAIAPGNIIFKGGAWDKKINRDKKIALRVKDKVPLKRFGRPEEVGNLCVFLSSNKSSFINGAVIVIDGGQTVSI